MIATQPACTIVRHGFTLDDLDHASRVAVSRTRYMAADRAELYQTAWDGALDALLGMETVTFQDLVRAGTQALWDYRNDFRHHHGYSTQADRALMPGFLAFWSSNPTWSSTIEEVVVNRLATEQITAALTTQQLRVLTARAAAESNDQAAQVLGMNQLYTRQLLNQSRKAFIALWHEHETPVRRREYMRRVRTADTIQPCGTVAAYNRHVRRREATCEECRAAAAAYQRARVSARQAEVSR